MKIRLGEKTTNAVSKVNNINGWQNRAVYGVTALLSQPFFDYKNPSVDKTTQNYSLIKTLIKIAVGTAIGIAFRVPFQHLGQRLYKKGVFNTAKLALLNTDTKLHSKFDLILKSRVGSLTHRPEADYLSATQIDENKFAKNVGNVFSIIGAVIGILSVDILISNKLLSHFNKKLQRKDGAK